MRILIHDYAGHAFPVQLSRELARNGHQVTHAYAAGLLTPRGALDRRVGDQGGYAVDLAESFPSVAVNLIHKWQCEDVGYVHRARKARKQYLDLVLENGKALSELLS
jgi:colanic acid biosynthesis glycosyl transferase WcaI